MAVALADAVEPDFQVIDKTVLGWGLVCALLLQLAHQLRRHVLAHAGDVIVAPMALQGVEVLLGATQENLGIKPGRRVVWLGRLRTRGAGCRGEQWRGFALHARGAASGLHLRLRAATEQLEQDKDNQAQQQDVEQLDPLKTVAKQHGSQQTTGGDTGQRTQPAAGAGVGRSARLLLAWCRLLITRGLLALGRLALVRR